MAFSLDIVITQNHRNTSSNSSNVTVKVNATWSGGTWNHEAPTSSVTIDGTKYTYNARLNPNRSTSGTNTIFTKTLDIKHNSDGTKTLTVHAMYNWRGVETSTSKTLVAIGASSGSSSSSSSGYGLAKVNDIGLQSGTERTLYVTWVWDQNNTENYQVRWYYATGDGPWFIGSDTTVDLKQSTYNAPENAKKVKVFVKPISKKHTVNNTETSYWTVGWSTEKVYDFSTAPPLKPPVPSVEITDDVLLAELDNLDVNGDEIQFQIVKNNSSVFNTGTATIVTSHVSYSCTVDQNAKYKVRCRSHRDGLYSDWSDYSSNINSMPYPPSAITVCKANSATSVYLEWTAVEGITTYDIEYTTKKEYFDGSDATTVVSGIEYTHYEKTGLETGSEYFFRVRAVDDNITSEWSSINSVVIGKDPAAPTTWSSTTTAIVGDPLYLYWVHNAEDGSSQTYAELEITIGENTESTIIQNSTEEDEKDKTSVYAIDTSVYTEGVQILWRVRTSGVTKNLGDWSAQRTVDIYARPTIDFGVTDVNGEIIDTLTAFPLYVSALAGPKTQIPVGYHLTVTANEAYETVDSIGNETIVNKGEQIYSKHFDINDKLVVELSASHIDLENNIPYTITCSAYMDSGLSAEASHNITVAWTDVSYIPNAEIGIDFDAYSASIRPYCLDEHGNNIENVMLSVYRREFDGTFTELAKNLDNTLNTFITDPHPALDLARYRIVATTKSTGAVSYYDPPGYPVGGKEIVIQWDEAWSNFETTSADAMVQPAWAGSMLKLPYNIDVSDKHSADVSMIEYIGRKYPVTYYGTQIGSTATWSVAIDKKDEETLYALRRLAIWMDDVYVREPSGTGYWANISVSFSQRHCETTIPVTLDITRVEGGI